MIDYSNFKAGEFETKELKDGNELNKPVEPLMDFVTFKNLASEKAGELAGKVVKIADGLIGTADDEIASIINERSKMAEFYYDANDKTSHTFMNFLHFLYASLDLTDKMVGYLKTIVVGPNKYTHEEISCPTEPDSPTDPIFSPMNDALNNICVKCGSLVCDLFTISEEFRAHKCEKNNDQPRYEYDVKHTTGVLDYINHELYIILNSCDNILSTIYGEHWNDTETVCGCETKVVR